MKFIIPGELPSMNEIIKSAKQGKGNYQPYNQIKSIYTNLVQCKTVDTYNLND